MRTRNWDLKLAAFRDQVLGEPYVWGETDCGSLVRRAVAVTYGLRPWVPPERGRWYDSLRGARELYGELGEGGLETVVADVWGAEEIGLGFGSNGDVFLREKAEERGWGEECGVLIDVHVLSSRPEDGVVLEPWDPEAAAEGACTLYRLPADRDPWGAESVASAAPEE